MIKSEANGKGLRVKVAWFVGAGVSFWLGKVVWCHCQTAQLMPRCTIRSSRCTTHTKWFDDRGSRNHYDYDTWCRNQCSRLYSDKCHVMPSSDIYCPVWQVHVNTSKMFRTTVDPKSAISRRRNRRVFKAPRSCTACSNTTIVETS